MKKPVLLSVTLVGVFALVAAAGDAAAKGPVDKIAFMLPGRQEPLEVTSRVALADFNPWDARFLGQPLDFTPEIGHGVEVSFYLRDGAAELQRIYGFSYVPSNNGATGYIYLPGSGESGYTLNVTTIIHSSEGKWHKATPEWDVFVASLLTGIRPPATGNGGLR